MLDSLRSLVIKGMFFGHTTSKDLFMEQKKVANHIHENATEYNFLL